MTRQLLLAALTLLVGSQYASAQTCNVTWRKADNPHVISGTVTIPADQTVCLEAGVQVQFASEGSLDLLGNIVGAGTAGDPITFIGENVFPNRITVQGALDLRFAEIGVPVSLDTGSFVFRDGRFNNRGTIHGGFSFLSLENVVFDSNNPIQGQNANITASSLTAILRNVTFRNGAYFIVYNSYILPDNLVSETSAAWGFEFGSLVQPLYLSNLSITDSVGPGLKLSGGNYLIGPNVVIQNAEYPIAGAAGLLPGSQVPATGNRNNWVETVQASGELIFAPVAVPYVMSAFNGGVTFLPGVTIKARPDFAFNSDGGGGVRLLGLPSAPITIEPFVPGEKWISGQFNTPGDRMEYVTLDGSELGILDPGGAGTTYYIDQSILRNHDTALVSPDFSSAFLQGNLFAGNGVAIDDENGSVRASGRTNPNLFEGNGAAVNAYAQFSDVRYNWWNSPTGPTSPLNPGGAGDILNGSRPRFQPFQTSRPDTTDRPPIVRMPPPTYGFGLGFYRGLLDAATRQMINWRATDDRQIVKQKVLFSPGGNEREDFTIIADNLPASQNSFELNVPSVGFQPSGLPAFVRVVAIDDKGQEGWDEWQVLVPSDENRGTLNITTNLAGQTFRGGDRFPLSWTSTFAFESYQVFLLLEGDRKLMTAASGNATGTFGEVVLPFVSTDSARFAVVASLSLNRQEWFFSPPFSIRPEARFPDRPPVVTMSSPTANQQFPAGGSIPIQWAAADDESLRGFDLQASTDGARTWVNIAENLPPTATSFVWRPNFSGALADVRVRVVAVDLRFQNSSDGANRVFNITAPANAAPSVQLTFPSNNASFASGKSIFFAASASDPDGSVSRVEFYATIDYIGQEGFPSTTLIGSDATAPYQVAWNDPSASTYAITARVIDNRGGTTVSAPVNVTVDQSSGDAPLPINPPELVEPRDGTAVAANSEITLVATRGNGTRTITRMEFYRGTTLLGSDTSAPYSLTLNNVPAGPQTFFARAVANNGAESTSPLADVSVGLPAPITTTLGKVGNSVTVTVPSTTGNTYQLERSPSLVPPNFAPIGNPQAGTGGILTLTDSSAPLDKAFYRVAISP